MRKPYVLLPAALATLALALPAAPSSADENPLGRCPADYEISPFLVVFEQDDNGNGIVCVKLTANGNVLIHDDPNGQPYRCNGVVPPEGCPAYVTDDVE
ncbi:MAG TPA: hypothetical protein VF520_15630 [Thermoleophilaceae bacterium]